VSEPTSSIEPLAQDAPPPPPQPSLGAVVGTRAAESTTALVDDLEIATGLGLGHVRFTIPWTLAQPKPGTLDGSVVEQVREAAQQIRANGGRLWLCLLAPDVPRWFDNEGGFTDSSTARHWWPRWVETIADAVGDDVDGWVPFEAPFAMANRLVPGDPRRHGELVDTLLECWRDAWRLLRGPVPVATSLDVRTVVIPRDDVVAAEHARREEHLRWHTWLRALRDGTITIPGRADRELADMAGACDQLGIATSGTGTSNDLEQLLHRTAEQGPDRPLAVTFRPAGPDRDARAETIDHVVRQCRALATSVPLQRLTLTDLDATAHALA
jgi:beta-glucosidase